MYWFSIERHAAKERGAKLYRSLIEVKVRETKLTARLSRARTALAARRMRMPVGPDCDPSTQEKVSRWTDNRGTEEHGAFSAWCLYHLFDIEEDNAFNQSDMLVQGDAGLDGWCFGRGRAYPTLPDRARTCPQNQLPTGGPIP